MRALYLVALAALCGTSIGVEVTPIQKIISLLQNLLDTSIKEKEDEAAMFNRFSAECDDYRIARNQAIDTLEGTIAVSKAKAETADAEAARLATEIAEHEMQIQYFTGDKKAATAVRQAENSDFQTDTADYVTAVEAITGAVKVLKESLGASKGEASLLQVSRLAIVPQSVRSHIVSFLQQTATPPKEQAYEFASNGILSMLNELKQKFIEENNELLNKEQASADAYKTLVADLDVRVSKKKQRLEEDTTNKEKNEGISAEENQNVVADTAAMKANTEARDERETTHTQMKVQFEAREKLRAGEIEAIQKAMEILKDGRMDTAGKHIRALLQIHSDAQVNMRIGQTASMLEMRSVALKSTILSAMSVSVRAGPFDKVIGMVRDMIAKLAEESAQEKELAEWCDNQLYDNEQTRDKHTKAACDLHTRINVGKAQIDQLESDIESLQQEIKSIDEEVSKSTEERNEERAENEKTIKESKEGIAAVQEATKVLEKFYKEAGQATALLSDDVVDDKSDTGARRQGARDFEKDKYEPELFSSSYTGGESSGVIGMLEVVQTDMERVLANTERSEAEAQETFEKFIEESRVNRIKATRLQEQKELSKQEKEQDVSVMVEDLEKTQQLLTESLDYYEKLKPTCIGSQIDLEDRKKQREEEIASLQEALKILQPKF